MKKIKNYILFITLSIICNIIYINNVQAEEMCTTEAAQQLAKILYTETGSGNFIGNVENYFFVEATTAGIILNQANGIDGDNWYEKIYNLSDNIYAGYSTYKDKPFETVVKEKRQGELLYIAELVLTGKYYLPKNLYGQASCACLLGTNHCEGVDTEVPWQNCTGKEGWAQEWIHFESVNPKAFDIYFGYSKYQSLYTTDIFGNKLPSTEPSYYRTLAKKYRLTDYSDYTVETVCNGNTLEKNNTTTTKPNNKIEFIEACKNPSILKIIYFIDIIIDIVKVIVPIALIVLGIINFSKSVGTNDVEVQKKSVKILAKRLLSAVIIFALPWLIEVIITILGDLTGKINFAECLENANKTKIELLEKELEEELKEDNEINEDDSSNKKIASPGEGLWVAHMKNSASRVEKAINDGFWGIEVDVYQSGNNFRLYHDSENDPYNGYDLDEFLDTCKANNITAVLDIKYVKNYELLISQVKEKNMEDNTIYQTWWGGANKIHTKDNNARIWVLIPDGNKDIKGDILNNLNSVKDYVEGVNMLALNVDKSDIKAVQDLGLTFCAFSYGNKMYNNASANTLREWKTNYLMANSIFEN